MDCKYNTLSFQDKIFLFNSISGLTDAIGGISTITNQALEIKATNVEFSEEETLNERYRFTKSVSFSVAGYNNLSLLDGRQYIALVTDDGRYILVSTEFPSTITYEYGLTSTDDATRYTFSIQENMPSLFLNKIDDIITIPDDVCSYASPNIDLYIILKKYINVDELTDRLVIYNGEWEKINAIRNSVEVNESLSNDRYTKSVSFQIPYTDNWQYLIGEFENNLYAAKVNSHKTKNIYLGNEFGLQPLYTIEGNVVTITLTEIANMPLVRLTNEEKSEIIGHRYIKTIYDPCHGNMRSLYVLREKVDGNGNGTGEYECYEGFEDIFTEYNITGTFTDEYTYYNPACKSENCRIRTDLPNALTYYECWGNDNTKKDTFSFRADCDWEVISGSSVTPTSGLANTDYTLTVPKYIYDSYGSNTIDTIVIAAGDLTLSIPYAFYADAEHNAPIYGLASDKSTYIDCNGGTVKLKVNDELIDWTKVDWDLEELPLRYDKGYIYVDVPPNTTTSDIELEFQGTTDEYKCGNIYFKLKIGRVWEFWAYNNDCDYICENGNKYHKEYRYTGTTSSNAVITNTFRKGELMEENCRDCLTIYYKWEQTYNILCVDGVAFFVDLEYESTDQTTWALSGGVRLRTQATNADIDACVNPEYEWRITENTVCDN